MSQEYEKIKTYDEINEKIREGNINVVTAEEMVEIVRELEADEAVKEVDVVTTGTFGAMCSSGAMINLGHSDPPIKIDRAWINDVKVSHPGAAVDLYIGATQMSETRPFEYGGGHVIEDLIAEKEVELRSIGYGTDCYPRTRLKIEITKDDLNQFILLNFRNAYQKYNAATNGTDKTIYTYMGKLLANYGNATFSGSGVLSPLSNDPDYEIIGLGTRIFLGGTQGYVIGEGTQHNPKKGFGTIMVRGDAKKMNTEYIRGACFTKYGTTLYVGLGIPIPILNPSLAKKTGISDEDIETSLVDYGVPKLNRPVLRKVSYAELKSGKIEINGKEVKISPLSSLNQARKIAEKLKEEIEKGKFFLSEPVEKLPTDTVFSPMKPEKEAIPFVRQVMKSAVTCKENDSLMEVAKKIVEKDVNHIVIVNDKGKLEGIVTSFDVTRAVALGETSLENIIVRKVITADPNESVAVAARVLDSYNISALPVIDHTNKVFGIITAEDVSRLLAR